MAKRFDELPVRLKVNMFLPIEGIGIYWVYDCGSNRIGCRQIFVGADPEVLCSIKPALWRV